MEEIIKQPANLQTRKIRIMALQMKILIALVFVLLFCLWKFLDWSLFRPRKLEKFLRRQGLKGNKYNFLVGDLKQLKQTMADAKTKSLDIGDDIKPRVGAYFWNTIQKHGNDSFIWIGPKLNVIITEPELVKEIMTKMDSFGKTISSNPVARLLTTGIVAYEGEKWAKHRRILTPAFHIEKLKLMIPAFVLSCEEVMNKWEKSMSVDGSGEIDVWPYTQNITSDGISRTAFGSSYEEGRKIFEIRRQQALFVIKAAQSIYIPGSRFLPTKSNKRVKAMEIEVQALIRDLIDKRTRAMKEGEPKSDLLSLMLESNLQEMKEHGNKKYGMSMEDIIEECKLLYIAGQETTSVLLCWTLVLLSKHQDWQEKAREEVVRTFGKQTPHYEGLNNLKIVNMILHEVLRLYPPIIVLGRQVNEEVKLGNVTLPVGVNVTLPFLALHQDPKVWGEDALEFKPERFSEGVTKAMKTNGIFCPFGWGPRMCMGQTFALLEAKTVISMILQRFSFELSPSYTHAPIFSITIQPQHGAHLKFHKL